MFPVFVVHVLVDPVLVDPDVTIEIVCVTGSITICESAKIVPSAKYKVPSKMMIPTFLFSMRAYLKIKYEENCDCCEYI